MPASSVAESIINFFGVGKGVFSTYTYLVSAEYEFFFADKVK